MLNFQQLNIGDTARVLGMQGGEKAYCQRLRAMGLTKGTEFTVIRKAPWGDPFAIQVRNTVLCLRKAEAAVLQVEYVMP